MNKTDLILTEGGSEMLTATVKPDDATDKTVTWSTSDATVATVENGKVTALKAGSAVITAKAGDKTATCKVTVNAKVIAVTSITLSKPELVLTEGESETLTATVKPDDATDKTVTWSTSDATVATVENGKVTALKAGSAVITAKAGEQSATCSVTVDAKVIAVTSITLSKSELVLTEGESETLTATVKPDDATNKSVTWSTSDATVATVENGKVTALKAGSAVITAKAGEQSTTCSVTVKEPDRPEGFNDEHRNW
ncbi:MAG: Ig domain-containing protein [Bacteroidales bacterium]|nr:Ig domain-containing protein [Bacteroidales bacterium]